MQLYMEIKMKIELVKIDTEFNTNSPYCWVQTRAGIFPDGRVLITSQPLRLSGSDIFYGINCFFSKDHACSWNGPIEQNYNAALLRTTRKLFCVMSLPSIMTVAAKC